MSVGGFDFPRFFDALVGRLRVGIPDIRRLCAAALFLGGLVLALPFQLAFAQVIPPTSPCTYGAATTPLGWSTGNGAPDCATVNINGLDGRSWTSGPIPNTPGEFTTFTSFHSGGASTSDP